MVYLDNSLIINKYKIKVGFFCVNENPVLNEIALDQIELFFTLLMHNSIIISKESYDSIKEIPLNNFLMTHQNPDDQTIASMILYKLIKIVGNNLDIDYVSLSSTSGNKIKYTISTDSQEPSILLPSKETWWNDKNCKFDPWWERGDTATYDKLLSRDKIYTGEFFWEEMFKDDLKEAAEFDAPKSTKKGFKLIPGGKDAD
jgi:hypothetical protein